MDRLENLRRDLRTGEEWDRRTIGYSSVGEWWWVHEGTLVGNIIESYTEEKPMLSLLGLWECSAPSIKYGRLVCLNARQHCNTATLVIAVTRHNSKRTGNAIASKLFPGSTLDNVIIHIQFRFRNFYLDEVKIHCFLRILRGNYLPLTFLQSVVYRPWCITE